MNSFYDFIVVGSGISGCTFASSLNKRFSDASILLVEYGRRIGGRSTTRKSRKNKILEFDHGLPSISFGENISQDLLSIISPLIKSKKLIDITQDILVIDQFGELYHAYRNKKVYRSLPFMINFCEEIISQSINPQNINFLFQTITKSIRRKNDLWEVEINNQKFLSSKNLILSSSLIAHPRCLRILNIDSLPLRDAVIKGNDKTLDSLLRITSKQEYIKRKNYILHVLKSQIISKFNYKYLQIHFSRSIRDDFNFERIIFQVQSDGSMIIVLHCCSINSLFDRDFDEIIESLIMIFDKHKNFLDLFLQANFFDTMDWRASQPINNFVPKELNWSSISNIGFCGDWLDFDGCSCVEVAMNSSISLAQSIGWK
ncbi:NAD(P)-binding protein [Prochlorococcus marinus]|uniref:NAD(P)-binding protein n=1 Tax=Prochlorococcus marinus TaxID=1219 RepID=UPI0022B363F8|nr:NAD(P)-binding protein [Prochlorococcus marinus]